MRNPALALTALLLAGCSLPGADRPAPPVLPAAFEAVPPGEAVAVRDTAWWTVFDSAMLDALVGEATAANQDLAAGVQRVAQARSQVRVAGAALLPQAGASGSASRSYSDRSGAGTAASAGLSVSYEVDLFGAGAAAVAGADAGYDAQRHAFRALTLAVQGDTASGYFDLLAARLRLAAAQNSLAAQERVLQLVESRYEQGAVSGFDLTRQRAAVAVARARIPGLEEAVDRQENALAILLGRPPQGFAVDGRDLFAVALPSVATGLPSELLLRRPDLLGAEAGLRAADADVSAARAAFFPRLDLTAALSGVDLTGAAGIASSLAAGLVAPIFSGGRLEGGLERAEARHAELVATYRQQILVALVEVENALLAGQSADRQEEQLRVAVEQAESALAAAETRYAAGAEDLLGVLDAQQTLLNANESLVTARARRLTATVDLIRALGGGWEAGGRA